MGRTHLGYITGFTSGDTIPIYERFTPAAPAWTASAVTARTRLVESLRLRCRRRCRGCLHARVQAPAVRQLSFLAFADAGNAWDPIDQFSFSDLKRGAGVGVRLEIPMLGLIGFDFGYGFDKDDPGWEPHFQIGRTF